uniref:Secreted protein n=1 Tax=Panstrongylus lignarius TaxID=156445 RepID=A0A224Y2K1_9HEMI
MLTCLIKVVILLTSVIMSTHTGSNFFSNRQDLRLFPESSLFQQLLVLYWPSFYYVETQDGLNSGHRCVCEPVRSSLVFQWGGAPLVLYSIFFFLVASSH